ncbi:MAG TPA: ABC-type transport auxiliary lipoprotein family protein [Desulfatiglandales bacterium]|nr:ABC-type transport auxiliary lipoprotein family protein [Desulfatiglandales bacterium]
MYHKKSVVLIVGISLILGACVNLRQPSNKIEYYVLEYDPPLFTDMDQLPYAVSVEYLAVAPIYDTTQIIYRERSFTREAYAYHRWRVNPGEMITSLLNRDIRYSGLFKTVTSHDSQYGARFSLGGEVEEFYEWDTEEGWKAVLSLSISLISVNERDVDKRVFYQKSYRATETCKQKNPRALAEALSLEMSRLSREIISDVYEHLSN